jgi:SOS-response transcriptional repressor LexA
MRNELPIKKSRAKGATPRPERDGNKHGWKRLSARQRALLEFVADFTKRRGFAPNLREMGDAVGVSSLSSVTHLVTRLSEVGFVEFTPRTPRSIRVVGLPVGEAAPKIIPTLLNRIDTIVWHDAETKVDLRSAKDIREGLAKMAADFNWETELTGT